MLNSVHFTFSYKALNLKQGGSVYSELRTICLSNFSPIPAVHQCHKLIIDQRLTLLMFTVSCLWLYPHHSYVSFLQSYVQHQEWKIKPDLQQSFTVTITTRALWYWSINIFTVFLNCLDTLHGTGIYLLFIVTFLAQQKSFLADVFTLLYWFHTLFN